MKNRILERSVIGGGKSYTPQIFSFRKITNIGFIKYSLFWRGLSDFNKFNPEHDVILVPANLFYQDVFYDNKFSALQLIEKYHKQELSKKIQKRKYKIKQSL